MSCNKVIDPFGIEYKSEKKMAEAFGVSYHKFFARKTKNWTLRECLEIDKRNSNKVSDGHGNKFNSQSAMAQHYGVEYQTYLQRKNNGWALDECLGLSGRSLDVKKADGECINKLLRIELYSDGKTFKRMQGRGRCHCGRRRYKVRILSTNKIRYMTSDQIKAYTEEVVK